TKDFKYTLNQNFEVQIAQAKDKTGQYQDYAELYELDSGINRINKLEITKFQVIKSSNIEKAKFRWWDLKLDLGIDYIVLKSLNHSFGGDLGLSFMSYGKSTGLTWRFIRIFAGVNTADLIYGLTPVMYNIASPLPVVSNIWLGPILGRTFNTHENFLGFGISAIL
ncbi:MAG TPA: hypothetical protein VKR58_12115, partial [Aquella sp.]|nr:hypothetical protein [Aquella sp.]